MSHNAMQTVVSTPSSAGAPQDIAGVLMNTARKYPELNSEGNQTAARKVTSFHIRRVNAPWFSGGVSGAFDTVALRKIYTVEPLYFELG